MGKTLFGKETFPTVIDTLKREILQLKMNRKEHAVAHLQRNFKIAQITQHQLYVDELDQMIIILKLKY